MPLDNCCICAKPIKIGEFRTTWTDEGAASGSAVKLAHLICVLSRRLEAPARCGLCEARDKEIERLRSLLRYVLADEPNLVPRASSECRRTIRKALGIGTPHV